MPPDGAKHPENDVFPANGSSMIKRPFDLIGASALLIVTAPIMLVVAVVIRLQDGGPAFYFQPRVGLGGRVFNMVKFRTMVLDADKIGGFSTADRDPRITPAGRFLRRSSLDELPQLFNVLVGDMSIVGPRPDVPAQATLYSPNEYKKRHAVRPGITGLAQATLRSNASPDERKALDLQYVDGASLTLDLKVLLLTVRQILVKGGN